jgi:hypothetical protein
LLATKETPSVHYPEDFNKMNDATCKTLPVFQKIVSTCKKIPTVDNFKLYSLTFNTLMNYSYSQGNAYISDHVFMSHEFPADIDIGACGNEKIRDATITQENQ